MLEFRYKYLLRKFITWNIISLKDQKPNGHRPQPQYPTRCKFNLPFKNQPHSRFRRCYTNQRDHQRVKNIRVFRQTACTVCTYFACGVALSENEWNKRRYRLATITGGELVKRLETCVGGNVKVSEWSIQCTVASGQTGPRSLAVFIWYARYPRGDETAMWRPEETERPWTTRKRDTETL